MTSCVSIVWVQKEWHRGEDSAPIPILALIHWRSRPISVTAAMGASKSSAAMLTIRSKAASGTEPLDPQFPQEREALVFMIRTQEIHRDRHPFNCIDHITLVRKD